MDSPKESVAMTDSMFTSRSNNNKSPTINIGIAAKLLKQGQVIVTKTKQIVESKVDSNILVTIINQLIDFLEKKDIENKQVKKTILNETENKRDQQCQQILKEVLDESRILYMLNNSNDQDKLIDLIDLLISVFDEYIHKDNYYDQKSILKDVFKFFSQISMKHQVQVFFYNSSYFYQVAATFVKKLVKGSTFWERDVLFLQTLGNIISNKDFMHFTDKKFLKYCSLIIQIYEFTQLDHTEAIENYKKVKRKDIVTTPPVEFTQHNQQCNEVLALLPAYLAEFVPQVKFRLAKNYDNENNVYEQFISFAILQKMCLDAIEKNEIYQQQQQVVPKMLNLLQNSQSIIQLSIIQFFIKYLKIVDMRFWLKFDNRYMGFDGSNTYQNIIVKGQPLFLDEQLGLYNDWGGYFDEDDLIYVQGGVQLDSNSQIPQYTISLWFIYPFKNKTDFFQNHGSEQLIEDEQKEIPEVKKRPFRTFIQCEKGIGCILGVQNDENLIFFDDNFQMYSYKLTYVQPGWNSLIMKVDNVTQTIKINLNRKLLVNQTKATISRNLFFFGNSVNKNEPCGAICDIRIYESVIPDELLEKIVHYHYSFENMPDFLHRELQEKQIVDFVINTFTKIADNMVLIELLQLIICLCTFRPLKIEFISKQIFDILVPLTYNSSFQVSLLAQKALLILW